MNLPPAPIAFDIPKLQAAAIRHETSCGDGAMVWHEWGSGAPVVLLHGGSGSWRHWLRNIGALAQQFRVIAADMPGYGASAMPPEPVSFSSLGAIMGTGLAELIGENEAYHIAGFSLGSFIAPHVIAHCPRKAKSLTLVHGHLIDKMEFSPQQSLKRWRNVTDDAERREILRYNLGTLMLAHPESADDATIDFYREDVEASRLRVPSFIDTLDTDILKQLDVAICAIAGQLDPTAKPDVQTQAAKLLAQHPHATCHIIENAGHWVMYEDWQTFNKLILEWLVNNS
jgi:2-hydroxy-6-oxonona-2,4-dienedioate hydrolase